MKTYNAYQEKIWNSIEKNRRVFHNAACPCCFNSWWFDEDFALYNMNQEELAFYTENNILYVLCENCENRDISTVLEDLEEHHVFYTFSY